MNDRMCSYTALQGQKGLFLVYMKLMAFPYNLPIPKKNCPDSEVYVLNHIPIVIIVKELIRSHGAEQLMHCIRALRGVLLRQRKQSGWIAPKSHHPHFSC
jgi:hypothetical protein